jgi:hypothetical protein
MPALTRIPADQQRLIFAGWALEDSRTLAELTTIQFGGAVGAMRSSSGGAAAAAPSSVVLRLEVSRSHTDLGAQLEAERAQREQAEPEPEPEPEPPPAPSKHDKRRRIASLAVEQESALEKEQKEAEADALGAADKPLPPGTRIAVAGHGRGSYVSCIERWFGANDHTIEFDNGTTVELQLRELQWTVKESEMEIFMRLSASVGPEPEPELSVDRPAWMDIVEVAEPADELGADSKTRQPTAVLPEGSPPTRTKSKDRGRKKEKKKKKSKAKLPAAEEASRGTGGTGGGPPGAPPPPPPPGGPPSSATPASGGGGRGDLLAAIQNGGTGMLRKTSATGVADQAGLRTGTQRTGPRQSEYGPPWNKKPPTVRFLALF